MSVLDRIGRPERTAGEYDERVSPGVVAGYGAVAAGAVFLVLFALLLAAWVTDPRSGGSWMAVLGSSGDAWSLAHGGRLHAPVVGAVVFTPLLVTFGAIALARIAARPVLATGSRRGLWPTTAAFVGGYAVAGVVISALGYLAPATPVLLWVVPGALLVPLIGFVWAVARDDGPLRAELAAQYDRVPPVARKAVRPGLEGLAALTGLGALIVLIAVLTHLSRIGAVSGTLDMGLIGVAMLWGGQLCALPNAAAWAATWASGGGLQIGPVDIGIGQVTPGTLPAFPVLGAIPEAGPLSPLMLLAPLAVVAIGAAIGWRVTSRTSLLSSVTNKLTQAAVASAIASVTVVIVALIGRAGLGDNAMAYVGPTPLACLLLIVEVMGAALLTTALVHWLKSSH
ncbi:DUF6350 family protein [Branchiibius sp. NY16-3462-2]|uniref:cell division protein PerM n=1 Tax=Branchiibius sp. NY16-3462-2 TaxID=1807500 RepID=UPI00079C361B|nr:DUF6350 family protein [Branchiibius sp. NY16-3462-2]KYH43093.1 hypothetical protein AZH51_06495 [Branchiibius sp. NY16-3462-2]